MTPRREEPTVSVRLQPRSSRPGPKGVREGVLELKVSSPPVDGRANEEARILLAKIFGVAKSAVRLVGGEKSRNKTFAVSGLTVQHVKRRLSEIPEKP